MKELTIPISDAAIRELKVGDPVALTGIMLTGRDAVHKWMIDTFINKTRQPEGDDLATYEERSDESNLRLCLHFCKRCATTVMLTVERFPGMRIITGGTFGDPNWFKIDRHVWTRSAQHWMVFPPDVGRFEKGSQGAKLTLPS